MGALFNQELFSFLAHDEVPPYYGVAYKFYLAGPLQFLNILMHPSATFGHPFLFPMFLGLLLKIFGLSSLIAKIYIFLISALSLFGFIKLFRTFIRDNYLVCFYLVLLLASSMYYINLPLLLGDTALLALSILYLHHIFNQNYRNAIILAFFIGLTRESFLIFLFAIIIAEFLFQRFNNQKDRELLKTLLWSPLSVILWYFYNLIAEKKLLHTYASLDRSNTSYFDFTISYWLENAQNKFYTIFILDPIIGVSLIATIVSLFFFKRLTTIHKRLIFYSLAINLVTFIILGFYHIFLDRYLLYSAYLLVLNFILLINFLFTDSKLKYPLILSPLLLYFIHVPKFSEPYYGKKVNTAYSMTLDALKFISDRRELDKPIVLCFPYQLFTLNEMGLYPRHPFAITHYNKFNIKEIDAPYFYFICRPDIEEDTYYKEYFKNLEKDKLKQFKQNDQELEVWLFTN